MGLFGRKVGVFRVTGKGKVKCTCGKTAVLSSDEHKITCSSHYAKNFGRVMNIQGEDYDNPDDQYYSLGHR